MKAGNGAQRSDRIGYLFIRSLRVVALPAFVRWIFPARAIQPWREKITALQR